MYPSNKYVVVVFGNQRIRIWQRTHTHIHRYTSLICLKIGYQAILKAILHWHVVSIHSYRPGISVFISSPQWPVLAPRCHWLLKALRAMMQSTAFEVGPQRCRDCLRVIAGNLFGCGHTCRRCGTKRKIKCFAKYPRLATTAWNWGNQQAPKIFGLFFFLFRTFFFLFVLPVLTFPTWLMHLKDSMGLLFSDLPQSSSDSSTRRIHVCYIW